MTQMAVHGMTFELRLTLLGIGVLFVAVLTWWELHRRRHAGGAGSLERTPAHEPSADAPARTRISSLPLPEMRAREPLVMRDLPTAQVELDPPHVPVLTPAGRDEAPEPPYAINEADDPDAGELAPESAASRAAREAVAPTVAEAAGITREALPELPAAAPPRVDWPPDAERRIVALRLVAPLPERFAGRLVRQALAAEGFVIGRFAIFHKGDEEQRAVLSAASLSRPGTFDMQTMDTQHYGGLSLFAVLPGPKPPPQAFDELVFTARSLNERLCGVLQDEQGSPLTPARIALLRERLGDGAHP
jgi:cell division protein ZipA